MLKESNFRIYNEFKAINKDNSVDSVLKHCSLADLAIGQSAIILEIRCEGDYRRRLLDLGLIPGTRIKADMISPLGNPVAYRFRGSLIALRKEDSSKIIISKNNNMGVDKIRQEIHS
jgi:ferrous iron transport protein A